MMFLLRLLPREEKEIFFACKIKLAGEKGREIKTWLLKGGRSKLRNRVMMMEGKKVVKVATPRWRHAKIA